MTQASSSVASFAELGIIAPLCNRLSELGYVSPTPIQAATIPAVLSGQDVLAGANTGSGKTAAFALPLLQRLSEAKSADKSAGVVRCLVLVPTRELAQQVADSFLSYASHFNGQLKIVAAFGGVSVNLQMQSLRAGADVLVATPGRLLDLLASNALKLNRVSTLVLDEADRMLSLGFTDELKQVLEALPAKKQTLLFSATFPEEVRALTTQLLHQPLE
ncbi:MAG: DEAD/DEAH box helicase, partial [Shewanella sp.]